jgi:hypothetical protein
MKNWIPIWLVCKSYVHEIVHGFVQVFTDPKLVSAIECINDEK